MTTQSIITTKERIDYLLNSIVEKPFEFTDEYFNELLKNDSGLVFQDIRQFVCRVFDINERILLEESDANNTPNRKSQLKRARRFYKKFRSGFLRNKNGNKVIVAEGDSWFEFPYFIDDIIDHLSSISNYNVFSLAYGGDWITNILYEGKYIEKLSVFSPDVFLVSGGGNDLVGSDRLGIMINSTGGCRKKYHSEDMIKRKVIEIFGNEAEAMLSGDDISVFYEIQDHVKPAFYSFIWIMRLQYALMFQGIHKKYENLKIITQAYDYAIPSPDYHGYKFISRQYWVNRLLGTGRWLYTPMMINGLVDREKQKAVIRYMIFEFNLMFASIAKGNKNVFHVDCRGVAKGADDWYDELHLKSEKFAQIARAYKCCIDFDTSKDEGPKIYYAKKF